MNVLNSVALWMMLMASVFLMGYGSRSASAQQSSGMEKSAAKDPSDIYPDSRARIPQAKREDFTNTEELKAYDGIVGRDNKIPTNATGIRLHFPIVADHLREALNELRQTDLEPKYRELAILTGARESNGAHEFTTHTRSGLEAGLPQAAIDVLIHNQDVKGLGEEEQTIIRFVREMHREPKVSSKTFADMERLFGRKHTLNMALLALTYSSSAMLIKAYDIQLGPDEKPFPSH